MNKKRPVFYLLLTPVLFWLFILIVIPHLDLLLRSFLVENDAGLKVFSLNNYLAFFNDSIYWLTFVNTTMIAIGVTILSFIVTFPVAFYLTKVVNKKYLSVLVLMLLLPLWIGELVAIYGWLILLGDHGVINKLLISMGIISSPIEMLYTDFSMILGLLYISMLFMLLPMMSTLDSMDDHLIEAAINLGASKWMIFTRIIIPYSIPGVVSGGIMVFMLVVADYIAPNILGGKSSLWFTEQIYNKFLATLDWSGGAAFGFLLLMLSSSVIWIALKVSGQKLEKVGSS